MKNRKYNQGNKTGFQYGISKPERERERQEERPKNTDLGDPPIQMVQTAQPTVKSIVKTLLMCSQVHRFQSFGCLLPNMN